MKNLVGLVSSAALFAWATYGCTSDKASPEESGGSGGKGNAGSAALAGRSGGAGKTGASGDNQGGESGGDGSQAGGGGSSASGGSAHSGGSGGTTGATGGTRSSGGTQGTTGGSAGAGAGEGGTDGGGELLGELADYPGPLSVDQMPILIDKSYIVDTDTAVRKVAFDADGNVFVATGSTSIEKIRKYDSDLAQKWENDTLVPVNAFVYGMAVSADGEVFVGGDTYVALPGETQNGSALDAFVAKLDANGDQEWAHQWGSAGAESTRFLAAGPDGSVLATGLCGGQVPGEPPDNAGGPFAARYASNGTRSWLKQYPPTEDGTGTPGTAFGPTSLLADADGVLYSGSGSPAYLRKIDADGTWLFDQVLATSTVQVPAFGRYSVYASDVAFAPDGSGIFDFINAAGGPMGRAGLLAKFDLDGKMLWSRRGGTQTAVLDPVEGVTWKGGFPNTETYGAFTVTADSLYAAGYYDNTYQNGSSPRPATHPAFVARFNLAGEELWFQEFLLDLAPTANDPTAPATFGGLGADADGNVVVVANGYGAVEVSPGQYGATQSVYMFKLSKADGSVL